MYRQIEAPPSLQKLVCFFYSMEHHEKDGPLQNLLPSNTEIMGWQYAGKWRVQFHEKPEIKSFLLPDFYTTGQQTLGYNLTAEQGFAGILGAALQPGSLWQIFKKPVAVFKNSIHLTQEVFKAFNAQQYLQAYSTAQNESQRLDILVAFYEHLLSRIQWQNDVIFDAVNLIYEHQGALNVSDILEKLNLNERYLQRNFKKIIGTTPAEFIRNLRFGNLFTLLHISPGERNKAHLARLYNYYDLSHFQKDYRHYFKDLPSRQTENRLKLFRELVEKDPYLLQSQRKK